MPSPKSGKPGSAVNPAAPSAAEEAAKSSPGEADQVKAEAQRKQKGNFNPYKRDPSKKSWIEIELTDEGNKPVSGEAYRIVLPDGETAAEGTLDDKGFARVDGIEPGICRITFPNLEKQAWKPK